MRNAFDLLGVTPFDNSEKIRESCEEKALLADNDNELNIACNNLVNIKKRIKEEVSYFSAVGYKLFDDVFLTSKISSHEIICSAIISVGKWFDAHRDNLINVINDAREIAGFSLINNSDLVISEVENLKGRTIQIIMDYLNSLDHGEIVIIFNDLVKNENYLSFFVDDLLENYETLLKNEIQNKEKNCLDNFESIKLAASAFIEHGQLNNAAMSKYINTFKKTIQEWDDLVQPLQVNYRNRGAQHAASLSLASKLRNDIIDLCNKSNKAIADHVNKIFYDYAAKQEFPGRIKSLIEFIDLMIKLLMILNSIYAEIEIFAETLKNDITDFKDNKKNLQELLNKITPAKPAVTQSTTLKNYTQTSEINSARTSNIDYDKPSDHKAILVTLVIIIIAGVIAFGSFVGTPAEFGGIICAICAIVGGVFCYKWCKSNIEFNTVKVGTIILAIIVGLAVPISAANSTEVPNGVLTVSNFKDGFDTTFSATSSGDLKYDISPKTSAYANNSRSSSTITVVILYEYIGTQTHSKSVTVTLYKSSGYRAAGSEKYTSYISFYYSKTSIKITSVTGSVYM